jgi:hypothetical protein
MTPTPEAVGFPAHASCRVASRRIIRVVLVIVFWIEAESVIQAPVDLSIHLPTRYDVWTVADRIPYPISPICRLRGAALIVQLTKCGFALWAVL